MPVDRELGDIVKALANMNLIVDWFPTIMKSPDKLEEVRGNAREEFYLLATYVFVIALKMEYLCKVTQAYGPKGDPPIARQLKADYEAILQGKDWRERAYAAQAAMVRLYGEIGKEHQATLDRVAGK